MNKLTKYIAMFLWGGIALVAVYFFLFPKGEDYRALNKALVKVTNQYLNDREVEPKSVQGSGKYFDLIRIYAVHLVEKREIEKDFELETKAINSSISSEMLSDPTKVDAGIERADKYQILVQESVTKITESVDKYQQKFDELIEDGDDMVPTTSLFRKMGKGVEAKTEQAKVRLGLAQHIKALLEFVKSRNGLFTVNNGKVQFTTPEEQAYYDQMYSRIFDINKMLDGLKTDEKLAFRQDLSIELPAGQDFNE